MSKRSASDNPTENNEFKKFLKKAIPYLTGGSHATAPLISAFLLVHLSAPILANVGGSSLSSQTMLFGREYYQTSFGERCLLLCPLTIHALCGLSKRLLILRKRSSKHDNSNSEAIPPLRPLSSLMSVTGYSVAFLFLPIHYLTHRVYPTDPSPAILSLGPSELDYEFVKVGLKYWPWRSWFLYSGLVGFTVLHTVDGLGIIWNTWFRNSRWFSTGDNNDTVAEKRKRSWSLMKMNKKWRLRIGLVGVVLPTLTGLYCLSREPMYTFTSNIKRCQNVLRTMWIYRM